MAEPYIGEIRIFGFNFATRGWVFCDGQFLPVQQYQALASVIGFTYGGNGTTQFAVPNLQERIPLCYGQGAGLSSNALGQKGGYESITLTESQIPSHNHSMVVSNQTANNNNPQNLYCGIHNETSGKGNVYKTNPSMPLNAPFSQYAVMGTGGNLGHENRQPFLALNFCIATEGIYPTAD